MRMGGVLAGLQSSLTAAEQTARWAERDTAAHHEALHGERGKKEAEELEMADIRLGDETHPTPIIMAGNQSNGLGSTLAALALGGLLGGGGLAAGAAGMYLLNKSPEVVQPPDTNERMDIGLGRIEDYLGASE